MIYVKLVITLLVILPIVATNSVGQTTEQISEQYLKLDGESRYEDARRLMDDSLRFEDPTGDVFSGGVGEAALIGADAFVSVQKTWGIERSDFNRDVSFHVGEYAVHWGVNSIATSGGRVSIPFATVHRVRDGKLIERTDFGEYIESFGLGDGFSNATAITDSVSQAYVEAHLAGDVDSQRDLMSDSIHFQIPTSYVLGKDCGSARVGAEEVMRFMYNACERGRALSMDVSTRFVANHHAVLLGRITFHNDAGNLPRYAVIVIEVKNGLVSRHWEYVDYGSR